MADQPKVLDTMLICFKRTRLDKWSQEKENSRMLCKLPLLNVISSFPREVGCPR